MPSISIPAAIIGSVGSAIGGAGAALGGALGLGAGAGAAAAGIGDATLLSGLTVTAGGAGAAAAGGLGLGGAAALGAGALGAGALASGALGDGGVGIDPNANGAISPDGSVAPGASYTANPASGLGGVGGSGGLLNTIGQLGGSLIQANGAQNAASTQANAALQAQQTQLAMYNQTRQDLSPFTSTGSSAISQLAGLFGLNGQNGGVPNAQAATSALTQFPGYQFGLSQGQTALDRSAASQGMTLSGAQLKASQQFGQNYGMQQAWNPYVSQLNSMAGLGENAAAQVGNNGLQTGQGVAQSQMSAGSAAASNNITQANIGQNLLTSGLSAVGNAGNWFPGASSALPLNY